MSDSKPLLDKADALMQRHRATADVAPAATDQAWLPVLTDVVTRGTPPTRVEPVAAVTADDDETEQLVRDLAPRLTAAMEKKVVAELRKNIDDTVATVLLQLNLDVHEIVRDAVAEKLKASKPDSAKPDS
jgi:hypothetical protein